VVEDQIGLDPTVGDEHALARELGERDGGHCSMLPGWRPKAMGAAM
jgi:hypothetical protein